MVDKSHVEPAHPMIVDLLDDLIAVYKLFREKYQPQIDKAFDDVSRQIGFVVTTTVPVEVEIGADRKIKSVTGGAENLKGTLFEKIVSAVGAGDSIGGKGGPGKLSAYLVWFPALKLKLRTEFMEPAHLSIGGVLSTPQAELSKRFIGRVPHIGEPVHWFDPGFAIAAEDAVQINALDEVYPEFKLADRVTAVRQAARTLGPGVREPAHLAQLTPGVREPAHLAQLAPGVREPAHFFGTDKGAQFAAELSALLKKFGM